MRRFFDLLNRGIVVLVVLFLGVAVNSFLFFGYYVPNVQDIKVQNDAPTARTVVSDAPEAPTAETTLRMREATTATPSAGASFTAR